MKQSKKERQLVAVGVAKRVREWGIARHVYSDDAAKAKHALWARSVWTSLAEYVNARRPTKRDAENLANLCSLLSWEIKGNEAIRKAQGDRDDVRNILLWVSAPQRDADTTIRAVAAISQHVNCIHPKLQPLRDWHENSEGAPVAGPFITRELSAPHFTDLVARIVYESLEDCGDGLARLSLSTPLRVCDRPGCEKLFVREGKISRCQLHRDQPWRLPPDIHRRRKWVRDQIKDIHWATGAEKKDCEVAIARLDRALGKGRLRKSFDGVWKDSMAIAIRTDLAKEIRRNPAEYVPYKSKEEGSR